MRIERVPRIIPYAIVLATLVGGAALTAADVIARLGFNETEARERTLQSLSTGNVQVAPAGKAVKALAPAARATVVSSALAWVKTYTESADFATRYAALRDRQKPKAPASADEQVKKMTEEQKKAIEELKANAAAAPPDTRRQLDAAIKQNEQMLNDPQKAAMMKQIYEQAAASDRQQYEAEMARWNERYPQDARRLIATRLEKFLEISADVDYAAQLTTRGRVSVFAKPEYENRSSEWKLCYRAGKPAVDAARLFATEWLAAIDRSTKTTH